MKKLSALALAGLFAMQAPAFAATVYDNGSPLPGSGNESTAWIQTEDFTLGSATTLTGAGVYLAGRPDIGVYDGQFQYYIFGDNAGNPGTILQSGSVSPTLTDTGVSSGFGGLIYQFAFNFNAPVAAAAGTTYHLGFHASAPGDFSRDELYWLITAPNGTATGIESQGGTLDNYFNNGQEHAFYLTSAVPEPTTWALMISGFGMIGGAMRRRQNVRVSYAA